ncbi:hypothetical protein [Haloarcula argentinensis]|uniref:Small CPxCG-related zinc finger protein n=1 Tax=Haloarcula argentinensis TaxID=43776 RepID=A0ABU2F2Z9_HALAR|nr:hypothetical protein [Haloarcula argentinensis]MDS0254945.1 hypothetical protein [Haloarcula argentinensis]
MSKLHPRGTSQFVCPFCEQTFDQSRAACDNCDSTVVVSLESRSVYDTILPMCGR